MKNLLSIVFILLIANMNSAIAFNVGGMDAGAVNRQYAQDMRIHEIKSRSQNRSAIVKPKTALQEKTIPDVVTEIKNISFVNNVNIPTQELSMVVEDKINQPMNAQNLASIRKDLMKYYQANGYYSAVPIITKQDNTTGTIVIQIEEGSKNSIIIE